MSVLSPLFLSDQQSRNLDPTNHPVISTGASRCCLCDAQWRDPCICTCPCFALLAVIPQGSASSFVLASLSVIPSGICFCSCLSPPKLCHPERSRRTPKVSAHLNRSSLFNQKSALQPSYTPQTPLAKSLPKNKFPQPPSKTTQNQHVNPLSTPTTHQTRVPTADFSLPALA